MKLTLTPRGKEIIEAFGGNLVALAELIQRDLNPKDGARLASNEADVAVDGTASHLRGVHFQGEKSGIKFLAEWAGVNTHGWTVAGARLASAYESEWRSFKRIINFPRIVSSGTSVNNFSSAFNISSLIIGWNFITMIPHVLEAGYRVWTDEKSGNEGIFRVFERFGGEVESGLNVLERQAGVIFQYLVRSFPGFEKLQDDVHRHSGADKTSSPVVDLFITVNVGTDWLLHSPSIAQSLRLGNRVGFSLAGTASHLRGVHFQGVESTKRESNTPEKLTVMARGVFYQRLLRELDNFIKSLRGGTPSNFIQQLVQDIQTRQDSNTNILEDHFRQANFSAARLADNKKSGMAQLPWAISKAGTVAVTHFQPAARGARLARRERGRSSRKIETSWADIIVTADFRKVDRLLSNADRKKLHQLLYRIDYSGLKNSDLAEMLAYLNDFEGTDLDLKNLHSPLTIYPKFLVPVSESLDSRRPFKDRQRVEALVKWSSFLGADYGAAMSRLADIIELVWFKEKTLVHFRTKTERARIINHIRGAKYDGARLSKINKDSIKYGFETSDWGKIGVARNKWDLVRSISAQLIKYPDIRVVALNLNLKSKEMPWIELSDEESNSVNPKTAEEIVEVILEEYGRASGTEWEIYEIEYQKYDSDSNKYSWEKALGIRVVPPATLEDSTKEHGPSGVVSKSLSLVDNVLMEGLGSGAFDMKPASTDPTDSFVYAANQFIEKFQDLNTDVEMVLHFWNEVYRIIQEYFLEPRDVSRVLWDLAKKLAGEKSSKAVDIYDFFDAFKQLRDFMKSFGARLATRLHSKTVLNRAAAVHKKFISGKKVEIKIVLDTLENLSQEVVPTVARSQYEDFFGHVMERYERQPGYIWVMVYPLLLKLSSRSTSQRATEAKKIFTDEAAILTTELTPKQKRAQPEVLEVFWHAVTTPGEFEMYPTAKGTSALKKGKKVGQQLRLAYVSVQQNHSIASLPTWDDVVIRCALNPSDYRSARGAKTARTKAEKGEVAVYANPLVRKGKIIAPGELIYRGKTVSWAHLKKYIQRSGATRLLFEGVSLQKSSNDNKQFSILGEPYMSNEPKSSLTDEISVIVDVVTVTPQMGLTSDQRQVYPVPTQMEVFAAEGEPTEDIQKILSPDNQRPLLKAATSINKKFWRLKSVRGHKQYWIKGIKLSKSETRAPDGKNRLTSFSIMGKKYTTDIIFDSELDQRAIAYYDARSKTVQIIFDSTGRQVYPSESHLVVYLDPPMEAGQVSEEAVLFRTVGTIQPEFWKQPKVRKAKKVVITGYHTVSSAYGENLKTRDQKLSFIYNLHPYTTEIPFEENVTLTVVFEKVGKTWRPQQAFREDTKQLVYPTNGQKKVYTGRLVGRKPDEAEPKLFEATSTIHESLIEEDELLSAGIISIDGIETSKSSNGPIFRFLNDPYYTALAYEQEPLNLILIIDAGKKEVLEAYDRATNEKVYPLPAGFKRKRDGRLLTKPLHAGRVSRARNEQTVYTVPLNNYNNRDAVANFIFGRIFLKSIGIQSSNDVWLRLKKFNYTSIQVKVRDLSGEGQGIQLLIYKPGEATSNDEKYFQRVFYLPSENRFVEMESTDHFVYFTRQLEGVPVFEESYLWQAPEGKTKLSLAGYYLFRDKRRKRGAESVYFTTGYNGPVAKNHHRVLPMTLYFRARHLPDKQTEILAFDDPKSTKPKKAVGHWIWDEKKAEMTRVHFSPVGTYSWFRRVMKGEQNFDKPSYRVCAVSGTPKTIELPCGVGTRVERELDGAQVGHLQAVIFPQEPQRMMIFTDKIGDADFGIFDPLAKHLVAVRYVERKGENYVIQDDWKLATRRLRQTAKGRVLAPVLISIHSELNHPTKIMENSKGESISTTVGSKGEYLMIRYLPNRRIALYLLDEYLIPYRLVNTGTAAAGGLTWDAGSKTMREFSKKDEDETLGFMFKQGLLTREQHFNHYKNNFNLELSRISKMIEEYAVGEKRGRDETKRFFDDFSQFISGTASLLVAGQDLLKIIGRDDPRKKRELEADLRVMRSKIEQVQEAIAAAHIRRVVGARLAAAQSLERMHLMPESETLEQSGQKNISRDPVRKLIKSRGARLIGLGSGSAGFDELVLAVNSQEGRLMALETPGGGTAILSFKKKNRGQVQVYVGGRPFRIVKSRSVKTRGGQAAELISYQDLINTLKAFDRRFNQSLSKELPGKPMEAYLHLDSFKGLSIQDQAEAVKTLIYSIAARKTKYLEIHLVGEDRLVKLAQAVIASSSRLREKPFTVGDQIQHQEASQVHLLSQDYLKINRIALLGQATAKGVKARFVKIQDLVHDNNMEDIVLPNPLLSLMDRVGAIENLSVEDAVFNQVYEWFKNLTGFALSKEEFLGLILGDEALINLYAVPPTLRAVDLAEAMNAHAHFRRLSEQAA